MEAKVPIYIKEHFKYRATSIDKIICRNKILEFQKRKKHMHSVFKIKQVVTKAFKVVIKLTIYWTSQTFV